MDSSRKEHSEGKTQKNNGIIIMAEIQIGICQNPKNNPTTSIAPNEYNPKKHHSDSCKYFSKKQSDRKRYDNFPFVFSKIPPNIMVCANCEYWKRTGKLVQSSFSNSSKSSQP